MSIQKIRLFLPLYIEPWENGQNKGGHLFGFGQTNSALAQVVDRVIASQERVTKDGKWTNRLREVHSHEAADAGAGDLQSVVVRSDGEVVAAKSESDIRERVPLGTVKSVLAIPRLCGTNLGVAMITS